MRRVVPLLALFALLCGGFLARPASAAEFIGSYQAFIGREDLFNSRGQRLTAAWQVLRQDRANVHRFRLAQPGDQTDPFFTTARSREAMEKMLRAGAIDRRTAAAIVAGGAMVEVRLYGTGGVVEYLDVRVLN